MLSTPELTVPKSMRGGRDEGLATIHSADDRFAPESVPVVVKVLPVVSFMIVKVKVEAL